MSRVLCALAVLFASGSALFALPEQSQAATGELSPPSATFPDLTLGQRSPQQQFTFEDQGPEAIAVEGVSIAGANAADFSVEGNGCSGTHLEGGQSCSVYVSFAPSADGLREAQLEIVHNGTNSPAIAGLSGRGLRQELTLSPSPVLFSTTTVGNSTESQVTVANNSEASVAVYGANIEGAGAGEFDITGSNCGTLQPAQSCSISIRFSPPSAGEERAFLRVPSEGQPGEQKVELLGVAASPELRFEPESYAFGLQRIKEGSSQTTMQLRNTGPASVQVFLEVAGDNSNVFYLGSSNCYGDILQPNETCSLQVNFDPNQPGFFVAQIRAHANGSTFSAEVNGSGGQAIFSGAPNPADFGETAVGGAGVTRTVTMTNSGDLPGGVFIAILSGGDTGSFQLLSENCTGTEVAPGGSCTAQVRFQPTAPGLKSAQLSFVGDGEGIVQVNLGGVGLAPNLTLAPNGRNFGNQTENTSGAAQLFALTNNTGAPVAINDATIAGANSDQFRLSSNTCFEATLPAGGECQVGVRFAPDSTGAKTATLRVNGAGENLSAPLTGSGIESAPTPAPSSTISLGKWKANTKKGTATLSVSVPGAGRLQLSGGGVKQAQKSASQKGNVSLPITPTAQTASQLQKSGSAKVKVTVSFTPSGGSSGKKAKTYQLVKTS